MSTLLLRLAGPMQSWGTRSRFRERDTGLEPSKSGVIGLICAAMGIPREDDAALARLAKLWMGVRVDREGRLLRDFQTAGGGRWPGLRQYGVIKADGSAPDTVISNRYYLADAVFLVALGGERRLLGEIDAALRNPVWPLCLGRKAFPPGAQIWLEDGLRPGEPEEELRSYPWLVTDLPKTPSKDEQPSLRLILECPPGQGQRCMDQPVSFAFGRRRHTVRYIRQDEVKLSSLRGGEAGCTCPA